MILRSVIATLIAALLAPLSASVASDEAAHSDQAGDGGFHFAWEISPLLAKAGCAAADCHGGASGRGGFKLSLFSSDPHEDFLALTRELGGRRIDLLQPEDSLLLRKPTRQNIKHRGGRLLKADDKDPAYSALRAWIERGAPWTAGLPAEPVQLQLRIENNQASVTATAESATSNGEPNLIHRDVTRLTRFQSTNEAVAEIDENGRVTQVGHGETWIIASYGQLRDRMALMIPFEKWLTERKSIAIPESDHPMDREWQSRLAKLGLSPAPPAPDHVLVRRLFFDLAGRPPRPDEVAAFLELPDTDRVPRTVDQLLQKSEFAEVLGRRLAEWFEIPISERDPKNSAAVNSRLREHLDRSAQRGDSLEAIVRSILLEADGQPAWKRLSDPRDRAEYIGRTLLGRSIDCARCHNHPLDRWKQEEHLQFSAFFSDDRPDPNAPAMMQVGRFFEPETGREIQPALLPLGSPPPESWNEHPPARNDQLAWMVLDGAREEMARHFANRVFASLIGRPLVDAPDDHRLSNPAVHEGMLLLLARELQEQNLDLRSLFRLVATSQLYAASSSIDDDAPVSGSPELTYLARREARRLDSHDFRRAVSAVLGVEIDAPLPSDSPLARQLFLLNSGMIQNALATPGNQVEAIHDFVADPGQRLEDLYRLIFSRGPTEEERKALLPSLKSADNERQAIFDLAFALLASREFGSIR